MVDDVFAVVEFFYALVIGVLASNFAEVHYVGSVHRKGILKTIEVPVLE